MSAARSLVWLLLTLIVAVPGAMISSLPSDGIVIDGADASMTITASAPSGLPAQLEERPVVWYANEIRHADLTPVSGELSDVLGQVTERFKVWYANELRHAETIRPPSSLEALLGSVQPRIVVWYADESRSCGLTYPIGLIPDSVAPQIAEIVASPSSASVEEIAWTTDELSDSVVMYGESSVSGSQMVLSELAYSHVVSDSLYTTDHLIVLTDLTPGATYYYRASSTDRSGNTATSSERSFVAGGYCTYLPLVVRGD